MTGFKEEFEDGRVVYKYYGKTVLEEKMEEGYAYGFALGMAKTMLKRGKPIDEIVEDTGLTREEVESL